MFKAKIETERSLFRAQTHLSHMQKDIVVTEERNVSEKPTCFCDGWLTQVIYGKKVTAHDHVDSLINGVATLCSSKQTHVVQGVKWVQMSWSGRKVFENLATEK